MATPLEDARNFIDEFLMVEILLCKDLSKHMSMLQSQIEKIMHTQKMDAMMAANGKEALFWFSHLRIQRDTARKALWDILGNDENTVNHVLSENKLLAEIQRTNLLNTFKQFVATSPKLRIYDHIQSHVTDVLYQWIRARIITHVLEQNEDSLLAD